MNRESRKQAIAAANRREVTAGVFAVRCQTAGAVWVGGWPDVDRVKNRIWFTLGQGGHPVRALQQCWNDHGADSFSFEVLERLEAEAVGADELSDAQNWARDHALRDRVACWREQLGAGAI